MVQVLLRSLKRETKERRNLRRGNSDRRGEDIKMALAKERTVATEPFFGNMYGGHHSDVSVFGFENYSKMMIEDEDGIEKTGCSVKNYMVNRLADDNTNPSSAMFDQNMNSLPEEEANESVINFKGAGGYDNWIHSSGSLLSFQQVDQRVLCNRYLKINHDDEYLNWEGVMENNNPRLSEDLNSFETSSTANKGSSRQVEDRFGWLYSGDGSDESMQEAGCPETNYHNKRPHMDGETQAAKKHCSGALKKPKFSNKSIAPSKDPQSIAAKNRRERISERLKILQDLVPNGTKVDLVTMLEKAISYVKFLQLQVKVLATDEFWPAQGGKAPEVAQVKEAIDAILSSHHTHRDRNSCSN